MSVIGTFDPQKPVHIYGAGMAGLFLGYFLKKKQIPFTIFEKSDHVGGKITTVINENGLIEKAANAIVMNDIVSEMLHELKLEPLYSPKGLKRIIFRNGRMQTFPFKISELGQIFLNLFKTIPSQAKSPTATVHDFFSPLLGGQICDEVLTPALGGIYASTSRELHLLSLFPEARQATYYFHFIFLLLRERNRYRKKIKKVLSVSFEYGMNELTNALGRYLKSEIILNSSQKLDNNFQNIICTDAHQAAELLKEEAHISQKLLQIPYQKILSATVFCKNPIVALENAFGILFPRNCDFKSLGILNNTSVFNRKKRFTNYNYTFISQAHTLEADFKKLHNLNDLIESEVKIWEKGIPSYNLERFLLVQQIELLLANKNLMLFAHYTGSLSLRGMAISAFEFVEKLGTTRR